MPKKVSLDSQRHDIFMMSARFVVTYQIIYKYTVVITGSDHLRDVFGHMGLSDKDIVALSGGHTLV